MFIISQASANSASVPVPAGEDNIGVAALHQRHDAFRKRLGAHLFYDPGIRLAGQISQVTPMVWPPASRAPRAEASINPLYPPLQTANPASANSFPAAVLPRKRARLAGQRTSKRYDIHIG